MSRGEQVCVPCAASVSARLHQCLRAETRQDGGEMEVVCVRSISKAILLYGWGASSLLKLAASLGVIPMTQRGSDGNVATCAPTNAWMAMENSRARSGGCGRSTQRAEACRRRALRGAAAGHCGQLYRTMDMGMPTDEGSKP